jgi:hypothetical protein
MITNPQVGMRVRFIDQSVSGHYRNLIGKIGTITRIHPSSTPTFPAFFVRFDGLNEPPDSWYGFRFALIDQHTQEYWDDQLRRQAHADKYL